MTINERVEEVALKYCADYPGIKTVDTLEQLYAIESTLEGTNLANEDCHKVIEYLCGLLDVTPDDAWTHINIVLDYKD